FFYSPPTWTVPLARRAPAPPGRPPRRPAGGGRGGRRRGRPPRARRPPARPPPPPPPPPRRAPPPPRPSPPPPPRRAPPPLATHLVSLNVRAQNETQFQAYVDAAQSLTERRMTRYIDLMVNSRGLVMAAPGVDAARWHTYAEALHLDRRFPGLQGLGYAERF